MVSAALFTQSRSWWIVHTLLLQGKAHA